MEPQRYLWLASIRQHFKHPLSRCRQHRTSSRISVCGMTTVVCWQPETSSYPRSGLVCSGGGSARAHRDRQGLQLAAKDPARARTDSQACQNEGPLLIGTSHRTTPCRPRHGASPSLPAHNTVLPICQQIRPCAGSLAHSGNTLRMPAAVWRREESGALWHGRQRCSSATVVACTAGLWSRHRPMQEIGRPANTN